MKSKYMRSVALDILVGRNCLNRTCRWTGRPFYTEEEKKELLALAALIKARKLNRGVSKLRRTWPRFCRKSDIKGKCSYCWPHSYSHKFKNIGWVARHRERNPKYWERYYA